MGMSADQHVRSALAQREIRVREHLVPYRIAGVTRKTLYRGLLLRDVLPAIGVDFEGSADRDQPELGPALVAGPGALGRKGRFILEKPHGDQLALAPLNSFHRDR
jgi:hypothetical protein